MTPISLGTGHTQEFLEREFSTLDLGDKRLKSRALKILKAQQEKSTSCIRRLFSCAKDMRQAYDFF